RAVVDPSGVAPLAAETLTASGERKSKACNVAHLSNGDSPALPMM
ncbi:MAG: hypothetical protein ACI9CV_001672, partial [Ilumatobacter sp.]